ncbi:O-Antigen ligase [Symmachiella dynata]|uniref:O-antigen ligase family protein n=1 Tax=Symmachiella dynata TaxID=2527995 RepID=UPI001189968B|nr:O-antigen ligase family protein [Symmachiella dynata]QDT46422.1 O-Antigen ligase [Symmachiella dynata]
MSISLVAFLALFVLFGLLAFTRPAWGVCLYMLTFFASPPYWWWGRDIATYRWNLYGGVGLLIAVLISRSVNPNSNQPVTAKTRRLITLATLLLINATAVHFLLSRNWGVSFGSYELVAKFVLLFFMMIAAIRTERDFKLVIMTLIIGMGYIGWEATINDRGKMVAGRLEGVGAPGATQANELASLAVTIIPLAGAFFMAGSRYQKFTAFLAAPFILNVILLCNSRGAFLSMIASGVAFAAFAPKAIRWRAFKLLCLGGVAVWLLLGDPEIVQRFMTSFTSSEELDSSASSRLQYWKAGIRMVSDYPLGAGGFGFKRVHGPKYIKEVNDQDFDGRSVHNGYINETCEWGIQGFLLKMLFVTTGLFVLRQTINHCTRQGRTNEALYGCGIAACMTAFLGTCMFGDRLDAEWGFWMMALIVAYSRIYGPTFQQFGRPQQLQQIPQNQNVPVVPGMQQPVASPQY